jgi:hypothetical protein
LTTARCVVIGNRTILTRPFNHKRNAFHPQLHRQKIPDCFRPLKRQPMIVVRRPATVGVTNDANRIDVRVLQTTADPLQLVPGRGAQFRAVRIEQQLACQGDQLGRVQRAKGVDIGPRPAAATVLAIVGKADEAEGLIAVDVIGNINRGVTSIRPRSRQFSPSVEIATAVGSTSGPTSKTWRSGPG